MIFFLLISKNNKIQNSLKLNLRFFFLERETHIQTSNFEVLPTSKASRFDTIFYFFWSAAHISLITECG